MAKWVKKSPWGDYTDVEQNHKFSKKDMVPVNAKHPKEFKILTANTQLLVQAKALGLFKGKHTGSKSIGKIKAALRIASKKAEAYHKLMKALKEKEDELNNTETKVEQESITTEETQQLNN